MCLPQDAVLFKWDTYCQARALMPQRPHSNLPKEACSLLFPRTLAHEPGVTKLSTLPLPPPECEWDGKPADPRHLSLSFSGSPGPILSPSRDRAGNGPGWYVFSTVTHTLSS